jgi:hypothetical protein
MYAFAWLLRYDVICQLSSLLLVRVYLAYPFKGVEVRLAIINASERSMLILRNVGLNVLIERRA